MQTRIYETLLERGPFTAVIMQEVDDDGNHIRFFGAVLDADGDYVEAFLDPEGREAVSYLENMELGDDDDQRPGQSPGHRTGPGSGPGM